MCGRKSKMFLLGLALSLLLSLPGYSDASYSTADEDLAELLAEARTQLQSTSRILSEYETRVGELQPQVETLQTRVTRLRTRQTLLEDSLTAAVESEQRLQTWTTELQQRYEIATTIAIASTTLAISLGVILAVK